jgi:succinate dehydrogenase/fumarate reductase flavoprotein subunit
LSIKESKISMAQRRDCDVLVIGSGAGGLAAAVTAAHLGKRVIVVEKDPDFGGTSAVSGGWIWVPCSPQAKAAGVKDSIAAARRYLEVEIGDRFDAARIDAYLATGPEAIEFFEKNSELAFDLGPTYPDYHPELEGGTVGGRGLLVKVYDGRALGREGRRLKPPLPEATFMGMMIGSGQELKHFMNATRSIKSFLFVSRLLVRFLRDRVFYGRSMRLTNGNAMIGRLAKTAFDKGVEILTSTPAVGLVFDDGRVSGAKVSHEGREIEIVAREGVVLASGGIAHDKEMQARLYPHVKRGSGHWSAVNPGATGDAMRMARSVGGDFEETFPNAAAWLPVSLVPRKGGGVGPFPHFLDRAKPGVIVVTPNGRRFMNEAVSYHDFIQGLAAATPAGRNAECFVVAGHSTVRKYGLGHVKPFPVPLDSALKSGYLKKGDTLEDLARTSGIDPAGLLASVKRYNENARQGLDPDYGRGSTAYNRFFGDPSHAPNPCVGPIEDGPYYAVRVVAGDLGSFAGIKTDASARVLDQHGQPIDGLYAVGNDAASIMSGTYPGPGITLGPAMTFGYLAARDIAQKATVRWRGGRKVETRRELSSATL